jgi:hypothetical protein
MAAASLAAITARPTKPSRRSGFVACRRRVIRRAVRPQFRTPQARERAVVKERWLRLDELENAIDNLEMAAWFLERIRSEKKWKWTIIAIHQALYGFAICAVRGTDSRWLTEKRGKKKKEWLISIRKALQRAKDPKWMPFGNSKLLVTTPEEDAAIDRLVDEFRNEFEHFKPKHWSIEVSGMPDIIGHVLRVVRFLALESNCVTYAEEEQESRVEKALARLEQGLAREATA